jgi:uncharacterized protein
VNNLKMLHMIAFLLVIIGAINWGLVGVFELNLVNKLLGGIPMLERLVYILVGVSALVLLATHAKDCRPCHDNR